MSDYLNDVLNKYNKNKEAAGGNNKFSRDERMKKFFNTILPQGETSGEKRIRIIPPKDGKLDEIYFHEVQVDGKWLKLWDPAQDGHRSPLNEVREKLLSTGKDEDKKLAMNYRSRLFYIFKVIDRDNEQDGIKFWRFKHNYKGDGILDKLFPIFHKIKNVDDPEAGRDLTLYITLTTNTNNGKSYSKVSTIMPEDPSPLHEDPETAKSWLEDDTQWDDAYAKKPVEYLDIVARGETPRFNKEMKKFVSEEEMESADEDETSDSVVEDKTLSNTNEALKTKDSVDPDPQSEEEPYGDDDLPF